MTMDEICAEVRADTTGYVGPAYRASLQPDGVVAFTLARPVSLEEIRRSATCGTTWTERGELFGTCVVCGLQRRITRLALLDGHWYCPDGNPRCQP